MIRNYLKTGLPFYSNINRQTRNDDCVEGNVFRLYVPDRRLLPFQIRSDEPVDAIVSADLMDLDGNVEQDLTAAGYDIETLITYDELEDYYYIIYDGDTFVNDLPTGEYYVQIEDVSGNTWYSEVFLVCDMTPVYCGLGDEMLTGWTSAVAPNNFDIAFTTDGKEITDAQSSQSQALAISNAITLLDGNGYRLRIDIGTYTNIAHGARIYYLDGAAEVDIDTPTGTGIYTYDFVSQVTGVSAIYIELDIGAGNISFAADVSLKEYEQCTYSEKIAIEWWNNCNLDGVIYDGVYRNRVYVDGHVFEPREEIIKTGWDQFGEFFEESVVVHEIYKLQLLVPEYMMLALLRLPLMDNVYFYLPSGESCKAKDVDINTQWVEGNYLNQMTIEFRQDEVIKTSCCDESESESSSS